MNMSTSVPSIFRIPAEILGGAILLFLGAENIVEVRQVCRLLDALIARLGRAESQHPLRWILSGYGCYWMLSNGQLFHSKRFENASTTDVFLPVRLRLHDENSLRAAMMVDDETFQMDRPGMVARLVLHRTHCSSVVCSRKVYIFGGRAMDTDVRLRNCYSVDPLTRVVFHVPPMQLKRSASAAALIGHRVFVFGGYNGESELGSMEVFNIQLHRWEVFDQNEQKWEPVDDNETTGSTSATIHQMDCAPICEHSAVVIANRYVVLMGGCVRRGHSDERSVASVWLFDTLSFSWERLPDMPRDRILGCASYHVDHTGKGHQIVFFGGQSLLSHRLNDWVTLQLVWCETESVSLIDGLRGATWVAARAEGGSPRMNPIAVQSNYSRCGCPQPDDAKTSARVVSGSVGLSLVTRPSGREQWMTVSRYLPTSTPVSVTGVWEIY